MIDMKCPNCGKTIPEISAVCPYCQSDIRLGEAKPMTDFGDISATDYDERANLITYMREPKNKKVIFFGIAVIVLVIVIFGILIASMFMTKKEKEYEKFTDVITTLSTYLIDNYTGNNAIKQGDYTLSLGINDFKTEFKGEYGLDLKGKVLSLTGSMRDPQENSGGLILDRKPFNFSMYGTLNHVYFKSLELYGDDYILFDIPEKYPFLGTLNYDMRTIIEGISDALITSLKAMPYTTESAKINHQGSEMTVFKRTLNLDNAGKKQLYIDFYRNLADDSNFINEISRIVGKNPEEIKKILANYQTTFEYAYSGNSSHSTKVSIYYKKDNIYQIELLVNEENHDDEIYTLEIGDNKYTFSYQKDNNLIANGTLSVTSSTIGGITAKTYSGTFDTEKALIDYTLELEFGDTAQVKRQDIPAYKNIKDFTEEDKNRVKSFLKEYNLDVNLIDKVIDIFTLKCDKATNCLCNDESDTCRCLYDNNGVTENISCPKSS